MRLTRSDFDQALAYEFVDAAKMGASSVTVQASKLHAKVGVYPRPDHRMPVCCDAMYGAMKQGDQVIARPPKGKGATLKIRYLLPR